MWVPRQGLKRTSSRLGLAAIWALFASLLSPQIAVANTPEVFTFTGSGYGHGVGMSQIGARGMALESSTAVEILGHFYPGTEVTATDDTQTIRINIGHRLQDATITMRPLSRTQPGLPSLTLLSGSIEPGVEAIESATVGTYFDDFTLSLFSQPDAIEVTRSSKTAKFAPLAPATSWTLRWDSQTVIQVRTAARTYLIRYGQIGIKWVSNSVAPGQMEITASMRLGDEYLYGLGEVPSSWPAAALEAQAIAARTFALTKLSRIRSACDCNIYSTTRDQNFVGFSKESEAIYGVRWREAVDRTRSLAVLWEQRPIQAFFFSSSGGMTQNVKDVWGSELPYLVNRPDSWSVNPRLNPRYARWTRNVSQAVMAKAFGLEDVDRYQVLTRSVTGSVLRIRATSSLGKRSTLSGETFRSRVGLPSTWFSLPQRSAQPATDSSVTLGGCVDRVETRFSSGRVCL